MNISERIRDLYDIRAGGFWKPRNIFFRAGLASILLVGIYIVANLAGHDFTWPVLVSASSLAILVTIQLMQARARRGRRD